MSKKYDDFLIELKDLLDKHGVAFSCHYDEMQVVNRDFLTGDDLPDIFEDKTTN